MGMSLALTAVEGDAIHALLRDPPLIWKVLAPDDHEAYLEARRQKSSWLQRLLGRTPAASVEPAVIPAPVAETDLDKAWHGLHYLFTGTAWGGDWPASFLVAGGASVGDIDVGYGPARAFSAAEVREIDAWLRHIDEATLRARFQPAEMDAMGIYPEIWSRDPEEDDAFGYCIENFIELKSFVASAARDGRGLVLSLC